MRKIRITIPELPPRKNELNYWGREKKKIWIRKYSDIADKRVDCKSITVKVVQYINNMRRDVDASSEVYLDYLVKNRIIPDDRYVTKYILEKRKSDKEYVVLEVWCNDSGS